MKNVPKFPMNMQILKLFPNVNQFQKKLQMYAVREVGCA